MEAGRIHISLTKNQAKIHSEPLHLAGKNGTFKTLVSLTSGLDSSLIVQLSLTTPASFQTVTSQWFDLLAKGG